MVDGTVDDTIQAFFHKVDYSTGLVAVPIQILTECMSTLYFKWENRKPPIA